MRYCIYTLILCFGVQVSADAQILKRLKKKAAESVEESATKRMEKKTEEEIEKAMDEIFESNQKQAKKNPNQAPYDTQPMRSSSSDKKPASSYVFDYRLIAEMHFDGQKDMGMDYLLSSKGKYYAMEMNQGMQMLMVTDVDRNVMFQFMDYGANKMMMAQDLTIDEIEEQEQIENTKFNTIPNKTIMGYDCEGIEMINDEMHTKIYFTKKAPVSFTFFNDPEQSQNLAIPKEVKALIDDDVLMLEMEMEDLTEGFKVIWRAKSLAKSSRKIETAGYQKM